MKDQPRAQKPIAQTTAFAIGNGERLTDEQAAAIKAFVQELGGIENARRAVAALQELKKAG